MPTDIVCPEGTAFERSSRADQPTDRAVGFTTCATDPEALNLQVETLRNHAFLTVRVTIRCFNLQTTTKSPPEFSGEIVVPP